jgi:hypothetical protein
MAAVVITRLSKELSNEEQEQNRLTPTGLLMEGNFPYRAPTHQ